MSENPNNPYPESLQTDLVNRLKRVEGQARGLQRMVQEGRSCEDIATQLSALKAAVNQVGSVLLSSYFVECVVKDLEDGKHVDDVQKRFVQLFGKL